MEKYQQAEDFTVMALHVPTFPKGISEAFDALEDTFGKERAFYGVSWMGEENKPEYYAAVAELSPGESDNYDYELITIEKGTYHTETVFDWMSKTDTVMSVFQRLMVGHTPSRNHPCIEWYKSDTEMICRFKA